MTEPDATPEPAPPGPGLAPADAVDPLDLLIVLGRHRRSLLLWPVLAAVLAAPVTLILPQAWTSTTSILPPQQAQSAAAAVLSQLGGLGNVAGGALGLKNPSDLYVAMLGSRSVADSLIERFRLQELWKLEYREDVRRALSGASRFAVDKSGVITIEVEARDPKLAADLANAYVEELHRLTSTLAVTEAAQRRAFFERQLGQAKEKLAEAEVRLRQAIDSGGLVSVDAQSRAAVETVARLRAGISAKEIQLGAMRAYATPENPDRRRAEGELQSMRRELERLEGGSGGEAPAGGGSGAAAGTGVGNIRLLREVKYQEVMFELLAKQLEIARVDESREAPMVQVLDRASPPEKRSKPKRRLIAMAAAALGLFAAVLAAFVVDAWSAASADPVRRQKVAALRSTWRWRRR